MLLWAKLDDDVNDADSIAARGIQRLASRRVQRAFSCLEDRGFPLLELFRAREQQREIESQPAGKTLRQLTDPPGNAVGIVVSHTARLTNNVDNLEPLRIIGDSVGRLITLLDACHDYRRDIREAQYNPLNGSLVEGQGDVSNAFDTLRHFLLLQLRAIRVQLTRAHLLRYQSTIVNILTIGLFDAAMAAYRQLSVELDCRISNELEPTACPYCKAMMRSHFCGACGTPRRWDNM